MWTFTETRNNCLPAFTHILWPPLLCYHDANASRSLLSPSMDFWWFPLSGVSVCVLQQRVRLNVINDSDDNQPLHPHHVPASLPKNLSEQIHLSSAVPCVVHFISNHGEVLSCEIFHKNSFSLSNEYSSSLLLAYGVSLATHLKHSLAQSWRKMENPRRHSSSSLDFYCRAPSSSFHTLASSTLFVSNTQNSTSSTRHQRRKTNSSSSETRTIFDWQSWCWQFSCALLCAFCRWWLWTCLTRRQSTLSLTWWLQFQPGAQRWLIR